MRCAWSREAGKPVIVSMGVGAASGGYYIACPADVIVALPSTLTGSIGVFGGKVVVRDLMERLGLTTGTVSHGARSLMYSARQGFTDDERAQLDATLDAIYADFVAKVAQGRGRPVEEIEAIARGRVWTGTDALRIGLVDELGGLRDALRIARSRAGLPSDAPVVGALHVPAAGPARPGAEQRGPTRRPGRDAAGALGPHCPARAHRVHGAAHAHDHPALTGRRGALAPQVGSGPR